MYQRLKLCVGTALALTLCLPVQAQDNVAPETVIATVNGTDITIGHMAMARANLPDQYQNLPADVLYDGLLEQLIQQTLLAATLSDIPRRLEIALENTSRQIFAREALDQFLAAAVTDESLQAAYDAEFGDFAPESEFDASHILLDTKEEAEVVLEKARAGEDFADLAREYSTGPSGPNGGALGWFGKGQMVPPFEAAVILMEPEDVSDAVETQFGWHIIRLNDLRTTNAPTLDEVRGNLMANIESDAAETVLTALTQAADVTQVEGVDPESIMNVDIFED